MSPSTPIPDLLARLNDLDESDDIEAKRSASDSGFAFMQRDVEREYPAFVRVRWVSAST